MLKEEKGIFFLAEMDEYSPDIMFSYEISVRCIFFITVYSVHSSEYNATLMQDHAGSDGKITLV